MQVIHILKGASRKPAYIEFIKENATKPTLLSIDKFRNRYGEKVTNEVLGIEPDTEERETVDEGLLQFAG